VSAAQAQGTVLSPGDTVAVLDADVPGHIRTPFYVRGKRGVIERAVGRFRTPEELAYGRSGEPKRILNRVRFAQAEVWPDYDAYQASTERVIPLFVCEPA
jgi:nitrile hydratase